MTDDLVKRLRTRRIPYDCGEFTVYDDDTECFEAADRIEALEAALRRLVSALRVNLLRMSPQSNKEIDDLIRAALGEKKDGNV